MKADKNKINVLIGINDFLIGGAQKLIIDQLKYFNKNIFNFYLLTFFQFEDKQNFYEQLPEGVKIIKLNFKGFFDFYSWIKLFFILIKIRPRVVISHLFFSNTILRLLKILFWYKIIIVEHNTYIRSRLFIFLNRILSYLTYRIIAVSETVAEYTSKNERINRDKFLVIHNGIDLQELINYKKLFLKDNWKDKLKTELGFSPNDKIIINVGRLTDQKNHSLLIRVFSKFSKMYSNYKLIVLGEGSLFGNLVKKVKEEGLENKILFLGAKKEIYKYYLISDFFISTSKIEGFGIAHVEALACGLPVLSTKTAGPDEIIKDGINGYLVDKIEDEDIILEAMIKLLKSNLNNLSKNAIESIKKFDILENVKKYENLIIIR